MSSVLDAPRLSYAEAAERVKVSVATLHRWRRIGVDGVKLRTVRFGGRSFILVADLERFVERRSDPTDSEPGDADAA